MRADDDLALRTCLIGRRFQVAKAERGKRKEKEIGLNVPD